MNAIRKFLSDENGATAVEYAIVATGISIVILGAVTLIGAALNTKYTTIAGAV